MPTILGANSVSGYEIANSGNFGSDGMFLTRTQSDSESDTDRRKFTISGWYKQTFQGTNVYQDMNPLISTMLLRL